MATSLAWPALKFGCRSVEHGPNQITLPRAFPGAVGFVGAQKKPPGWGLFEALGFRLWALGSLHRGNPSFWRIYADSFRPPASFTTRAFSPAVTRKCMCELAGLSPRCAFLFRSGAPLIASPPTTHTPDLRTHGIPPVTALLSFISIFIFPISVFCFRVRPGPLVSRPMAIKEPQRCDSSDGQPLHAHTYRVRHLHRANPVRPDSCPKCGYHCHRRVHNRRSVR